MSFRDLISQLNLSNVTERFRLTAGERELVKQQISIGNSPAQIEPTERVERRFEDLGIKRKTARDYARSMKAVADAQEMRRLPRPRNPGLERIIGSDELMSTAFLERGAEASKSVCCIVENGTRIGTGFLVAPQLLITNSHVIPSVESARMCVAEFNFEDRIDRVGIEDSVSFRLLPEKLFLTSDENDLDYTLVAVKPIAERRTDGTSQTLSLFGYLRLDPSVANALRGECLNILQHPNGAPKRVALRQNRFTALLERHVHYETDTCPGSSGSPVFNDQWQVICLHHAGVPLLDSSGNVLMRDNRIWNPDVDDPALIQWIGNEGIRISRIIADVNRRAAELNGDERPALLRDFPEDQAFPPNSEEALAPSPLPKSLKDKRMWRRKSDQDGDDRSTVTVSVSVGNCDPIVVRVCNDRSTAVAATHSHAYAIGGDSKPAATDTGNTGVERGLANLERSKKRVYYDAASDAEAKEAYYQDIDQDSGTLLDDIASLITTTHTVQLSYKAARIEHLYAWVDLQRNKKVRSVYSNEEFEPERFIKEDFTIERRLERMVERRLTRTGESSTASIERITAALEAQEAFNCEHVVPQSWFSNDAPMQGDLHHLFTCESKCNSFRGNRRYADFGKYSISREAERGKCGYSEDGQFEPFMGKGKVARATLYFLARYGGLFDNMYEESDGSIETLLDWHERSPATEHEMHRNQAIQEIQGNRNPFIDYPELAGLVFGA